ncbi:MAG: DUF6887 family protein [Pseudanabaenaceae cyanobacterium]
MSDLEKMTPQELRRYVLAHRHDQKTIELLAAQTRANPNLHTFSAAQADRLGEKDAQT